MVGVVGAAGHKFLYCEARLTLFDNHSSRSQPANTDIFLSWHKQLRPFFLDSRVFKEMSQYKKLLQMTGK